MLSRLLRRLKELLRSGHVGPVLLAVSVGLVGGAGAIVFRYLIRAADTCSSGEAKRRSAAWATATSSC